MMQNAIAPLNRFWNYFIITILFIFIGWSLPIIYDSIERHTLFFVSTWIFTPVIAFWSSFNVRTQDITVLEFKFYRIICWSNVFFMSFVIIAEFDHSPIFKIINSEWIIFLLMIIIPFLVYRGFRIGGDHIYQKKIIEKMNKDKYQEK